MVSCSQRWKMLVAVGAEGLADGVEETSDVETGEQDQR